MTQFFVQRGDVRNVPADLLLLKHAQGFFGADKAVADRLLFKRVCNAADISPPQGDFAIVNTKKAIAPKRVLFLGTPPLASLSYDEMYVFAFRAMGTLSELGLAVQTITTTIHGVGYGLDGGEALQRLVQGFQDGQQRHNVSSIEKITFLTLEERTERVLQAVLAKLVDPQSEPPETQSPETAVPNAEPAGEATSSAEQPAPAGLPVTAADSAEDSTPRTAPPHEPDPDHDEAAEPTAPVNPHAAAGADFARRTAPPEDRALSDKQSVFVAMPFEDEFLNVYDFCIYPAVRDAGFICERVDQEYFTGDVWQRIQDSIERAALVIGDMTTARPNVYLEVGYAWAKDVPVILVAKKGERLHFDVSGHRCLYYGRFPPFREELERMIRRVAGERHG